MYGLVFNQGPIKSEDKEKYFSSAKDPKMTMLAISEGPSQVKTANHIKTQHLRWL